MLDFVKLETKTKGGNIYIYPKFKICKASDLMIRGKDFYAVWDEDNKIWTQDEDRVIRIIDKMIKEEVNRIKSSTGSSNVSGLYMWDSDSGSIDRWHKYCQKQCRDNYIPLDDTLVFSNSKVSKKNYSSHSLNYALEEGTTNCWDELVGTLYSPNERHKIEWAIGCVVSGDSKNIQKFLVLYGSHGTGKSTILNIIQSLFDGYCASFSAKALGMSTESFALEAFRTNPLVGIQHDGDLSRIEDNTRLNSLISHEEMQVNEKYRPTYPMRFKTFLFMGTNNPVRITDAKSGIIRRLIDVSPNGDKIPIERYTYLLENIKYELGAIAYKCLKIYSKNKHYYDDYIPIKMFGETNDFFNFIEELYEKIKDKDGVSLNQAWKLYIEYVDSSRMKYPMSKRQFRSELTNYFKDYYQDYISENGVHIKNYYKGFRNTVFDAFQGKNEHDEFEDISNDISINDWIKFDSEESIFDTECQNCYAQYANDKGTPKLVWDNVKTKLKDLDTHETHFVKVPSNHIIIDFDMTDENGNKSLELNLKEANKWPKTYAELSKSGQGIHLHYIYTGDPTELARIFGDKIEIKVYTGNASLRRKLTKCCNNSFATISSGLPIIKKEVTKVIDHEVVMNERKIKAIIGNCLQKAYPKIPSTKSNIDFIYKILEDAYESGIKYDVSDLRKLVFGFAASSTHQSLYCINLVGKMHFKSKDEPETVTDSDEKPIAIYDVEVFPNVFIVCYKKYGKGNPCVKLINPSPEDIENIINSYRLVGFNNLNYDNNMLYAKLQGYSVEGLFELSDSIINRGEGQFMNARGISYTDIYDYSSKKQSLKKWEIELGLRHLEFKYPWDKPLPEDKWDEAAEYCCNDVIATEAVFDETKADFIGRTILAKLTNMTVNDRTNTLTRKLIFGNVKDTQPYLQYRNLGETNLDDTTPVDFDDYTRFNKDGMPVFPGYKFENGVSTYRGEIASEGGRVYSRAGMYGNVALLDIESMHPTSAIEENAFGIFTKRFAELKQARIYIKHKDWDNASKMMDGLLVPFIEEVKQGLYTAKDLAYALKIAINSVYGLTSAKFENAFRHKDNVDNIVAKRGSLFMINLQYEVEKRGFTVAHIKTDSIKIPDATPEIIKFVNDYGKMYGYNFEHEATYERMCLVNKAVYIARYATPEQCMKLYGYIPDECKEHGGQWTATGTQFQIPYVFKALFSKETITFEDMRETKSVKEGTMYLDFNEGMEDVSLYESLKEYRYKLSVHPDSLTKKAKALLDEYSYLSDEDIEKEICKGHMYQFIGKVGCLVPIMPGHGGGIAIRRDNKGKDFAVTGTKGFRWMEDEYVKTRHLESSIDRTYFDILVSKAVDAISEFGDFEWFISDEPYESPTTKNGELTNLDVGNVSVDLNTSNYGLDLDVDPLPESFN